MGVWIEIYIAEKQSLIEKVTPLVGVWIEITYVREILLSVKSLPLWECGLKYLICKSAGYARCHSPCGSVD